MQQLQPAVQQAIQRYNSAALITPVNVTTTQLYHLSCQVAGGAPAALTTVTQLAMMNPAPTAQNRRTVLSDSLCAERGATLPGADSRR